MILTDGVIMDQQDTVNAIVEASRLPMSIIVIGIGSADFSQMDKLDADVTPLCNSRGEFAERDIVQFVEFNECGGNQRILAEKVLEEIPSQIVKYYSMKNKFPNV